MVPFCWICIIYTLENETNFIIYQGGCRPTASLNLSSCDLISNNHNQFLKYLRTTYLSSLTVSFLRNRYFQYLLILNQRFYISLIEHAVTEIITRSSCLHREHGVCFYNLLLLFYSILFHSVIPKKSSLVCRKVRKLKPPSYPGVTGPG